ncbi:MAG TPA: phospholipid carrier-dependent glycosyltransferase [Bryobacterales bacterium]|nr:phospholipid carrier-dependent glycosyltransferase [Bryobacterales bacterium]
MAEPLQTSGVMAASPRGQAFPKAASARIGVAISAQRRPPLLVLGAFLAVWSVWSFRIHASAAFSQYHDDTMLMVSAQALAENGHYTIPSLAVPTSASPPQTKYPIFVPWLFSLVWRWNPHFPANLEAMQALAAFFGVLALAAAYAVLRTLKVGAWAAVGMTIFLALQPVFVVLSTKLLTDVPMMALTLAAAAAAERALGKRQGFFLCAAAGFLAALAVLTRTIGVAIVGGFLIAAVLRRRFRMAAVFIACCAPVVVWGLSRAHDSHVLDPWVRSGGAAFQSNWLFYTNYIGFWKLSVSSLHAFGYLIAQNFLMFAITPGLYFQFPPPGGLLIYLLFPLTAAILAGVLRHARQNGWQVIHFVFLLHTAIILCWTNREMIERFLLPFLPLLCAGLWTEGRYLSALFVQSFRAGRARARFLMAPLAAGVVLFAARGLEAGARYDWDYVTEVIPSHARRLQQKRELYAWVNANTAPSATFAAWDDGGLYLYTRRRGMRPIAFSTEYYYSRNPQTLTAEMAHIFDTARHIHAQYWVRVDGEYADTQIEKEIEKVLAPLPVLFRSSSGAVRLYDLRPVVTSPASQEEASAPRL